MASASNVQMALINVDSGPGAVKYQYVQSAVTLANNAHIPLAGYVATGYGNRDLQLVLSDITKYRTFYGLTSVFLDETPYQCDKVSFYQQIFDSVKAAGGTVILNPGMNPFECYAAISDVIVNFEGTSATYATWAPAAWTANYPAQHFWHIVYGSSPAAVANDMALAATRNAGWAYITDQTAPNPWSTLPSTNVWNALIGAPSAATSTSTTPSTVAATVPLATTTTTTTTPTTSPTTVPPTTTPTTVKGPTTTTTSTTPRRGAPSAASASAGTVQRTQAPSASPLVPTQQPLSLSGEIAVIQLSPTTPSSEPAASQTPDESEFREGILVLRPAKTGR